MNAELITSVLGVINWVDPSTTIADLARSANAIPNPISTTNPNSDSPPNNLDQLPPPPNSFPGAGAETGALPPGLPPFLAGQNPETLKMLSTNPGLLQMFIDPSHPSGYNQEGLLNLMGTLSATKGSSSSGLPPPGGGSAASPGGGMGMGMGMGMSMPRQDINEGNLHVSGYGEGTTAEEIKEVFGQYVVVHSVVAKGNFCFVNTNDHKGAQLAKVKLQGVLVRGRPLKCNDAFKKTGGGGGGVGGSASGGGGMIVS